MTNFTMLILFMFIPTLAGVYLFVLLTRYLHMQLKNGKKEVMVVGCNNENHFILDKEKNFSINVSFIKSLYIEETVIYAELVTGETFVIMKCENKEEATKQLEVLVKDLSLQQDMILQ